MLSLHSAIERKCDVLMCPHTIEKNNSLRCALKRWRKQNECSDLKFHNINLSIVSMNSFGVLCFPMAAVEAEYNPFHWQTFYWTR